MSSRSLAVRLHAAPVGARVAPDDPAARTDAALEARLSEARAEGEARALEGAAGLLATAAERVDAALEGARASFVTSAAELVLEIARQVLRVELAEDRYDVEAIVRDTLALSGVGRGECTVHLNPADVERLRSVTFRSGTAIEADNDVSRGSVHVTTTKGLLVREVDDIVREIGERIRGELPA